MDKVDINTYVDFKIDKQHNRLNFKGFKLNGNIVNKVKDNDSRRTIAITPFEFKDNYNSFVNINYNDNHINLDYCVVNVAELSKIITRLSDSAIRLLFGFMSNLEADTNFVQFNITHFARIINMTPKCTGIGINDLIKYNIAVRTNQAFTYVINHNLFFKGDLNKFKDNYKELYGDAIPKYNNEGKLIIK